MDTRPFSEWAWVRGYSPWGNHKIMSDYGNFLSKQHILPHFAQGAKEVHLFDHKEGTQTVPKYLKETEGEHRLKAVILASTLMKQHQYQRGDKFIRCWGSNSPHFFDRGCLPFLCVVFHLHTVRALKQKIHHLVDQGIITPVTEPTD